MSDDLLGRIDERLKALSERYHSDREETTKRYESEREERKQWRDGIEKMILPVVRDHEIIVRGGKWIITIVASGFGLFKAWLVIRNHIK